MLQSNYPNGFANGLTVRNLPLLQAQPGRIFWVGNGTTLLPNNTGGADGNPGTYQQPFATLQRGLDMCSANTGDIVMIKSGHAETIPDAATLLFNKAGVAIIGLGAGSERPTFTFSAAASNIPLTAANMVLQNVLFLSTHADVASLFTATGTATPTDFNLEMCEIRDTSSILNILTVITGNVTANCLSGLRVGRCRISSLGTTAATTAIKILSSIDRVEIQDNFYTGAILNDTAALLAAGANNITNFDFARNVAMRPNTSSTGGSFISTSGTAWTGHAYDNYLYQLDATAGIWIPTGTGIGFTNNFSPITGAADKSALINPVAV